MDSLSLLTFETSTVHTVDTVVSQKKRVTIGDQTGKKKTHNKTHLLTASM